MAISRNRHLCLVIIGLTTIAGYAQAPADKLPTSTVTTPQTTATSNNDLMWMTAGYSPKLSLNVVTTLRASELPSYNAMPDEKKIEYLQHNFPTMFRWDLNEPMRRKILQAATPDKMASYQAARTEDEQQVVAIKALGVNGIMVQLTDQIRRDAMDRLGENVKAYDKMGEQQKEMTFLFKWGNLVNHMNPKMAGTYRYQKNIDRAGKSLMIENMLPRLSFMDKPLIAAYEAAINNRELLAKTKILPGEFKDASTVLVEYAAATRQEPEPLLQRFDQADPIDKARQMLMVAKLAMDAHVQPTPMVLYYAYIGKSVVEGLDPAAASSWDGLTSEAKIAAIQHSFEHMVTDAKALLESQSSPELEKSLSQRMGLRGMGLEEPSVLVARYFGTAAYDKAPDSTAKKKLYDAALAWHLGLELNMIVSLQEWDLKAILN